MKNEEENAEIYYFTLSPHWELLKTSSYLADSWCGNMQVSLKKEVFVYCKFKVPIAIFIYPNICFDDATPLYFLKTHNIYILLNLTIARRLDEGQLESFVHGISFSFQVKCISLEIQHEWLLDSAKSFLVGCCNYFTFRTDSTHATNGITIEIQLFSLGGQQRWDLQTIIIATHSISFVATTGFGILFGINGSRNLQICNAANRRIANLAIAFLSSKADFLSLISQVIATSIIVWLNNVILHSIKVLNTSWWG